MFTVHPSVRPRRLFPNLHHCFVIHHITLTINEIFLIHLFSLEREATEVETCQVCQTQFMYQPLARRGNSLYKQFKQLSESDGSYADTLAHCNRTCDTTAIELGRVPCGQNQKYLKGELW